MAGKLRGPSVKDAALYLVVPIGPQNRADGQVVQISKQSAARGADFVLKIPFRVSLVEDAI